MSRHTLIARAIAAALLASSIFGIRWKSARADDRSKWKIPTGTQLSCLSLRDNVCLTAETAVGSVPSE